MTIGPLQPLTPLMRDDQPKYQPKADIYDLDLDVTNTTSISDGIQVTQSNNSCYSCTCGCTVSCQTCGCSGGTCATCTCYC
jgi:hypothetical protein